MIVSTEQKDKPMLAMSQFHDEDLFEQKAN